MTVPGIVSSMEIKPCVKLAIFQVSSWSFCAGTAIYTTKLLMTTSNYHYPATIAFRIFEILLIGYIFTLFVQTKTRDSRARIYSNLTFKIPNWSLLLPGWTWWYIAPAALSAALSLPILLKGILDMDSLAALLMLTPMISVAEWAVLTVGTSSPRHYQGIGRIWLAFLVIFASSVIVYHERRLTRSGLIWGVTSSLSIGITRAVIDIRFKMVEDTYGPSAKSHCRHSFVFLSLTFGLVISSLGAFLDKPYSSWHKTPMSAHFLSLLNILSFVGAILAGSRLLPYCPFSTVVVSTTSIPPVVAMPSISDALILSTPVLIVLMAIASLHPEVVITWTQLLSYLFSVVCAIELSGESIFGASKQNYTYLRKSPRLWDSNYLIRGTIALVPCYLALTLVFIKSSGMAEVAPSAYSAVLDTTYTSDSRFDIVVSMYQEETEGVRMMLEAIKGTKLLRTIVPRVILYTKNDQANATALKITTGADFVISLENRGREGATYLTHITTRWDELATQTLFIQAQPHDLNELLAQMNAYLVSDTGMLSLGITGVQCICSACEDASTWEDTWNLIPDLYQKVYNQKCDSNTSVLMTYAGQFITSARRIRGISKEIYEDLLEALTSENGWAHDPDKLGHEELVDAVDRPNFGFTIERTWALLMQCATNVRIATRCPSLLSGRWIRGDAGDCQCLDNERAKQ